MFGDYVFRKSSARYNKRILIFDSGELNWGKLYEDAFHAEGFEVIHYSNDLDFRIHFEEKLKSNVSKMLVIASQCQYIPYDLRSAMSVFTLSIKTIFPKLNATVLRRQSDLDLDLLCCAYQRIYDDLRDEDASEKYIRQDVYSRSNIIGMISSLYHDLVEQAKLTQSYKKWFRIAEEKARIDVLSASHRIDFDTSELNALFSDYAMREYGRLSSEISNDTPILVSKVLEYIAERSHNFIIIVMDGMSEFDWKILSNSFRDIPYSKTAALAMITTVTSVSRQSLLSNKFPIQLINPWTQAHEKSEFRDAAISLGYADFQIGYERGYDSDFSSKVKCGVVIINDIDDLVHGQQQGRIGMASDVAILGKQGKLATMVKRFLSHHYDVYITADHGNTLRRGIGRLTGTGVETETKSHCMLVLRDYAEKNHIKGKYNLLEYPKYYLPKEFDYLICNNGDSFDIKGEEVMTHGGISLDECVVPFVKIMAVKQRG